MNRLSSLGFLRYHISAGNLPGCPRECFSRLARRGEADLLQIRLPLLTPTQLNEEIVRTRKAMAGTGVPLLLNRNVELARIHGLDGVQLPATPAVAQVRVREGDEFLIGVSAHTPEEVKLAEEWGADFVTLGPVFPTPSKPGHPGLGLTALFQAAAGCRIPLLALGGLRFVDAAELQSRGIGGLAGIRLFHEAEPAADGAIQTRTQEVQP